MKENQIQVFQYNGSPVTFNSGDSVMVNATEMAKPFGKSAKHWLLNQSTKDFIEELAKVRNLTISEIVQVRVGSPENGGGTWMHEDVAMEFARWLSPAFAIWCNDRIKELMTKGTTSIAQLSRKELALMVVQAEEEKERLALENTQKALEIERQQSTIELQNATITQQAPKVSYYDTTLQSVNTLTTTQIAKEIGLDAAKLNKKLKEAGVIFRQSGMWMLRQPYSAWNLASTRTQTYTRSDGSTGTSIYTVWNERGRRFIHALNESKFKPKDAVRQIQGTLVIAGQ